LSALSIIQSVYVKVLSSRPPQAFSSADPKVQQCLEYVNEAAQELASRYTWQVLTNETLFNTTAVENQGTLLSLTGPGFNYIINNVMWNRSQRRPVFGPRSDAQWQELKATFINGPWVQFRIRQNQLLFNPIPAAGQQIAFEWMSKYWASDVNGVTFNSSFMADTDVSVLDERVIALDALWRFKRANQLSYDEDFDKAQAAIEDLMSRDAVKPTLNMGGGEADAFIGTIIPAGNWNGVAG